MDPVIELDNVTYWYPLTERPAIVDCSLEIYSGDFVGVVGKNGSGKTTLCALIRGFAPAFYRGELEGSVKVFGRETTDYGLGELARHIGFVFQNPFDQISGIKKTVFEEIAYGLENFGTPVDEIEDRVVEAMELTNITQVAFKNPFELSGGQQQRVALASTLVLKPEILVIDEPTSQLDPIGTENVFEVIRRMRDENRTVVLVEHKVDLMAEFATRVIVVDGGHIIANGTTEEILSDYALYERGVAIPQASIMCNRLKRHGMEMDHVPITVDGAATAICDYVKG